MMKEEIEASGVLNSEEKKAAIKFLEREKELREMDSRELLHRFGNVAGYHFNRQYMGKETADLEKELWEYESELLKRLCKRPNEFLPIKQ